MDSSNISIVWRMLAILFTCRCRSIKIEPVFTIANHFKRCKWKSLNLISKIVIDTKRVSMEYFKKNINPKRLKNSKHNENSIKPTKWECLILHWKLSDLHENKHWINKQLTRFWINNDFALQHKECEEKQSTRKISTNRWKKTLMPNKRLLILTPCQKKQKRV